MVQDVAQEEKLGHVRQSLEVVRRRSQPALGASGEALFAEQQHARCSTVSTFRTYIHDRPRLRGRALLTWNTSKLIIAPSVHAFLSATPRTSAIQVGGTVHSSGSTYSITVFYTR